MSKKLIKNIWRNLGVYSEKIVFVGFILYTVLYHIITNQYKELIALQDELIILQ